MVPNARFIELLGDIEPSATTKGHAASSHAAVRDHLGSHPAFEDWWVRAFLAGSYARDTAIRPRRVGDEYERADVDIVVVTTFDTNDHPDDILAEVEYALSEAFTVERVNKRSVRVVTSTTEIDVVPVVDWNGAYKLPDRDLGGWKPTNPPAHNEWSRDQNVRFDGRFKPLVKLFKWWRRENKTGKRPKGFVLEVLVALHAPDTELHYGEAFAQMLQNILDAYSGQLARGQKPVIEDPGLRGNDILSKVSMTDWTNFMARIRTHAGYARRAQEETDMEEATRLWRKLFGARFRTSAAPAKANVLSSVASVSAPMGGYVFPDAPAAPNKPRGFA